MFIIKILKKQKEKYFAFFLSILILIAIFRNWFSGTILSSGDWSYNFSNSVKFLTPFSLWDYRRLGLGTTRYENLWIEPYYGLSIQLSQFISWEFYERLFWFWPFLAISFLSSFLLSKKILNISYFSFLSAIIYTANTYILLIIGGGQVGVAMGYSLAPLILLYFLKLFYFDELNSKNSILFGILLSITVMFDVRITFASLVLFVILGSCLLLSNRISIPNLKKVFYIFLLPAVIILGFHFFWILPIFLAGSVLPQGISEAYIGEAAVKFFSFAKIENTISLLHPNWPHNIFGKVGFLKPQFLLFPLIAFSSFFYVFKNKKDSYLIPAFSIAALAGIFLAKGTNEPFGNIYEWLFLYFPGFKMFRDSTKWYLLIAISYSILIPFTLHSLLQSQIIKNFKIRKIFIYIIFLLIYVLLIFPIFITKNGTYTGHSISSEYVKFSNMISKDNDFYRILWVPSKHRFGYSSAIHPALKLSEIQKDENLLAFLRRKDFLEELQNLTIKYIVLPTDPEKEIFLSNSKYDASKRERIKRLLSSIKNLKRTFDINGLYVYEIPNPKPLFYLKNEGDVFIKRISQTKYVLSIKNAGSNPLLVFSDNYNKGWVIKTDDNKIVNSKSFGSKTNSFNLGKSGSYDVIVEFLPQKNLWIGLTISFISVLITLSYLIIKK